MSAEDDVDSKSFLGFLSGKSKNKDAISSSAGSLSYTVPVLPVISGYEYTMGHARRGKAIIFNHNKFNDRQMKSREGTEQDVKRLETVLAETYGFQVEVCPDFTYGQIFDKLYKAAGDDYSDCDCVMVVVLSHGESGKLHAKDISYDTADLWLPFTKCETLVGKPKIFFIQACRGEKLDSGNRVIATDSTQISSLPVMADILVMYSSFDGYYSFRSPEKGSWFIQRLCDELEKQENSARDILQILTFVNRTVALQHASNNPYNEEFHKKKQVGSIVSSMTRLLYLSKKINKVGENPGTNMEIDT